MGDTRKQIIELIEPFMDKTLNFGCYVYKHNGRGNEIFRIYENEQIDLCNAYTDGDLKEEVIIKIIGHYDTVAVLSYISMGLGVYIDSIDRYAGEKQLRVFLDETDRDGIKYNFKLKPLHLYSEQEEKQLLELLNKLKDD